MSTSRIQDKAVYIEDLSSKYAKTKCSIKEKKWSRVLQLYTLQKKNTPPPPPPQKNTKTPPETNKQKNAQQNIGKCVRNYDHMPVQKLLHKDLWKHKSKNTILESSLLIVRETKH